MTARIKWAGGKPLSTKSHFSNFPIVFVDVSPKSGKPQKIEEDLPARSDGTKEDQAIQAAAQWGSELGTSSDTWLKSWYYPSEAFDPWPEKTDLRCWFCTHPFPNTPFPLPWSYNKKENKWRVKGFFCGPSCAKAYALEKDMTIKGNVLCWIDEIAKKYYGYTYSMCNVIPIAPKRELLKEYCGPKGFTIEQFRNMCFHGRSIALHRPGFITVKQVIEAEQRTAMTHRGKGGISHKENPDRIITTKELTQTKREIFAGKGARRIGEFLK
jgi:hypothetical protein